MLYEVITKSKRIDKKIQEWKIKKSGILDNIQNIIDYPDLLESQNEVLQTIKQEIWKLQLQKVDDAKGIGLAQFKKCSKKVLEHLDKLVLEWEKPGLIQLIFEIVYEWNIEYEQLKSRTPVIREFRLQEAKKEPREKWGSSVNP